MALSYLLFVLMLSYLPPLPLLFSVEKGKKEAGIIGNAGIIGKIL